MILVRLSMRSVLHYWPLSLATLFTLALGIASLASIPVFLEIIAYRDVHQALLGHTFPGSRNILVEAEEGSRLSENLYNLISMKLNELIEERISVREIILPDLPPEPEAGSTETAQKFQFYHLRAFTDLDKRVRLIEGRFPHYQGACQLSDVTQLPILEAAVGVEAASKKGIKVGDIYTTEGTRRQFLLAVVGIVEPNDPQHDAWWEDRSTFGYQLELIGRSIELVTLSLHVPQETMEDCFPQFIYSWRILLDGNRITPKNAESLQETLTNLQAQLRKDHTELQSGLPSILLEFQNRLDTARMIGLLVVSQIFLYVSFTLGILVSVRVDQYRKEFSRLIDRGASKLQIILAFSLQDFILAWLATGFTWLVLSLCGISFLFAQFSRFVILAGGVCWLLITIQSTWAFLDITSPRNNWRRPDWNSHPYEHKSRVLPIWQKFYMDMILLFFSGILYWQLTRSGSLITRRIEGARLIDPFLLLSSTLLVIAAVLVSLRLMPILLGAFSWLARPGRGKYGFLALAQLSYDLHISGQISLLISLAVSFTLMANAFRTSLANTQEETASRISGADIRLSTNAGTPVSMLNSVSGLPGIIAASPILRSNYSRINNQSIDLLAIDPKSISQVNESLRRIPLERLNQETSNNSIPAIYSLSLVSSSGSIGEEREVIISGQEFQMKIVGIAPDFPTTGEKFILIDVYRLEERLDLRASHFEGEVWLEVEDRYLDPLIQENRLEDRNLSDVRTELSKMQSNSLSQGIDGAFRLNALALNLLSVAAFLVLHCFSFQKQSNEFDLTRAIGFDPAPSSRITNMQGLLTVFLGLMVGIGIGYSMTRLLLPYLWISLADSLGGMEVLSTIIDWIDFLDYCAIIMGSYVLILLILFLIKRSTAMRGFQLPVE